MAKTSFFIIFLLFIHPAFTQPVAQQLDAAIRQLESDSQLLHAVIGLCVVDTKTGQPVYQHHTQIGLAPASTQKLFTSCAAFDLLGEQYRYKTKLEFLPTGAAGGKEGLVLVKGSGDPTLGSWRYGATRRDSILNAWSAAIKSFSTGRHLSGIRVDDSGANNRLSVPKGYIWEDIGNYYGAGTTIANWNENQYDVVFKSGQTGTPATVVNISPEQQQVTFHNEITAGEAGSGDNAFIFCAPWSKEAYIQGTIPPGKTTFSISGSMPDPAWTLASDLRGRLLKDGIKIDSFLSAGRTYHGSDGGAATTEEIKNSVHYSLTLDSIIYWYLKRSINLYGEALAKTISKEKNGYYNLDSGVNIIRNFWSLHGIDKSAIHIADGSGLSPQNRVTTDALVKVLQYAKTRPWFGAFYYALPEYNGMKMKSGSIGGARAFAGYHTSRSGKEYTYAIIVNNYDGSSSLMVKKLFTVLDNLK